MFEAPCKICGSTDEVTFGPDPYAEEINGDSTPVWECRRCRRDSADEI